MTALLHGMHELLADPASEGFMLVVIVLAEFHAICADRQHLAVAKKTYALYQTYFEVTEKRKAEAREKAAATRAAKKHAASPESATETAPEAAEPPPTPPEGEVPPPMAMPEDEPEPHSADIS